MQRKNFLAGAATLLAGMALAWPQAVLAQAGWPNKPIRWVVPYPPGGITDHATRPFDPATFQAPPAICRGTPFWSWNGKLDRERLFRQLAALKEMGMG
jgi:hypothetical protein